MTFDDKKEIAIDRINLAISELENESRFEQVCILEGRVKGFLELSFAIELISFEENQKLWAIFAAVREKINSRFPR